MAYRSPSFSQTLLNVNQSSFGITQPQARHNLASPRGLNPTQQLTAGTAQPTRPLPPFRRSAAQSARSIMGTREYPWRADSAPALPTRAEFLANMPVCTDQQDCPVCQDPQTTTQETPCGHVFCKDCITEWLQDAHTCPMCREQLCQKGTPYVPFMTTAFGVRLEVMMGARSRGEGSIWWDTTPQEDDDGEEGGEEDEDENDGGFWVSDDEEEDEDEEEVEWTVWTLPSGDLWGDFDEWRRTRVNVQT